MIDLGNIYWRSWIKGFCTNVFRLLLSQISLPNVNHVFGMETSRSTFAEGEIEMTLGSMRSLLQCMRVFVCVPCEYSCDWASWDWSWSSWWSPRSNSQTSYRAVELTCTDDEKLRLDLVSEKAVTKSRTLVTCIGIFITQVRNWVFSLLWWLHSHQRF